MLLSGCAHRDTLFGSMYGVGPAPRDVQRAASDPFTEALPAGDLGGSSTLSEALAYAGPGEGAEPGIYRIHGAGRQAGPIQQTSHTAANGMGAMPYAPPAASGLPAGPAGQGAGANGAGPIGFDPSRRQAGICDPACPPGAYPALPCPIIINGPGVVAYDPTLYPDEYLCDGGDRGHPFHYEGRELGGFETEDTVADYVDENGKRHVKPSSRVCIYAPRFGAVRTMSGTLLAQQASSAAGAYDGIRSAGIDTRFAMIEETQRAGAHGLNLKSRPGQVDMQSQGVGLWQLGVAASHQTQAAAFQNLTFITEGTFRQADMAVLAYGLQAAAMWTREQNPVMLATDTRGHEVQVEFTAHEVVGDEDRRKPGELRVVKLADVDTARSGDVVTFTVRFDNLGQRELRNIRVMDNLTPRLQYIAGSATCDLPGSLDISPNNEGSSILTLTVDGPLPGEKGGVLTFQCRVR